MTPTNKPKVMLVSMPWASNSRPNLGVGVLSAIAKERGFDCTAMYPTFEFARNIGFGAYESLSENSGFFGVSEHLFAANAFGVEELRSDEFLSRFDSNGSNPFFALRDGVIPDFLDKVVAEICGQNPDIVGFSCTFNQVFASLAVAKRVKRCSPQTTTVMGGACVHGEMGQAYAATFQMYVDHVFTGEADETFPTFLSAWPEHKTKTRGVTYSGELFSEPRPLLVFGDSIPDYADWFLQRDANDLPPDEKLAIPFESSRGCWWGEKKHCTFCGLNNEGMRFRTKAPMQTVRELVEQSQKHSCLSFMAADNILDFRAHNSLLPEIEKLSIDFNLFYEIKGNLNREKAQHLSDSGVRWIQPGIESFSDHVLKLMKKGITALQNVLLLRLAAELGITVSYNILVGFPGEETSDYQEMIKLIRKLHHLPPPSGKAAVVQVHRFSPFFNDPDEHGIKGIRACDYYQYLLPKDSLPVERYAYFFDREIPVEEPVHEQLETLNEAIDRWEVGHTKQKKVAKMGPGYVEISTYEEGELQRRVVLDREESTVFMLADSIASLKTLQESVGDPCSIIDRLLHLDFLAGNGDRYVTLVPFDTPKTTASISGWLEVHGLHRDIPSGSLRGTDRLKSSTVV